MMHRAPTRVIRLLNSKRWSVENRTLRRWLLAILVALAVPAGLTFHLSQQRAFDLLGQAHYNDVFDAGQAEKALFRLDAEVGRFAIRPSEEGAALVRLRFEILLNHVEVVNNRVVRRSMDDVAPGLTSTIDATVAKVAPIMATIETPAAPERALDLLTPLEAPLAQAVSAMSERAIIKMYQRGEALQESGNTLLVLVLALFVTAVGLVVVLWQQHAGTRRLAYRDSSDAPVEPPFFQ